MTTDYSITVAKRLDDFLAHPSKRVLLFKGKWGVGKTHFWTKTYLPNRLRKSLGIKERLYSYVSLFGVESADDLEQLILVNSVKTGDKNALHFIETGLRKAVSIAELIPVLKDYQGLVRRVGHMAIRSTLICIDEIERKAAGLPLATVMGLISVLREHNGCRFALIMNDEQIKGEEALTFDRYREKVIDETISYTPAVEDNTRLIFGDNSSSTQIIEVFQRLDISNIRVMQQVAWVIEHFAPHFSSLEPAIKQQFREHIILLTSFFHIPEMGIDVNHLPRKSIMEYYFQKDEKDPEQKHEMEVARRYGYEIQEYDHIIVDYLKHGCCDEDRLRSLLQEVNSHEQKEQISTKFSNMWIPYNRSFKANTSEVLESIETFLDKHAANLSFSQLWDILKMTDALGARWKRRKWLDAWIAPRIQGSNLEGLCDLAKHCHSKKLKTNIRIRENELKQTISIAKLMTKVVEDSGWNPEIVRQLGSFRVDDFRRELRNHDDADFLATVQQFCESWKGSGPEERAVEKKVEDALLRIAKKNKLNEMRVRMIIPWTFSEKSGHVPEPMPGKPDVKE